MLQLEGNIVEIGRKYCFGYDTLVMKVETTRSNFDTSCSMSVWSIALPDINEYDCNAFHFYNSSFDFSDLLFASLGLVVNPKFVIPNIEKCAHA